MNVNTNDEQEFRQTGRKAGRPPGGEQVLTLTSEMVDQIKIDARKMTCDGIAAKFGVSGGTMRKYLLMYGLSTVEIKREFRRKCCRDAAEMGFEQSAKENGVKVSDIRNWSYTYGKDVGMPRMKMGPEPVMSITTYRIIGRLCEGETITEIAKDIGRSRQWVHQVRNLAEAAGIPVKGGEE